MGNRHIAVMTHAVKPQHCHAFAMDLHFANRQFALLREGNLMGTTCFHLKFIIPICKAAVSLPVLIGLCEEC